YTRRGPLSKKGFSRVEELPCFAPRRYSIPLSSNVRRGGRRSLDSHPGPHDRSSRLLEQCASSGRGTAAADCRESRRRGCDCCEACTANSEPNYGFNAETGRYGNLIEDGVIDPTKVTRTALQNAASIASMMLTTEALVFEPVERTPGAGESPESSLPSLP